MVVPPTLTALGKNDIFYPALIESLPVAIYTCNEEGYVTHYNAAAVQLWGREPEKGKEQWTGAWKLFRLDGSPLSKDQAPMAISLKEKRDGNCQEIIIERPDGTRRFIQVNPRSIVDTSGNFAGAVCLLVDVSSTKLVHQERERLSAIIQGSEDAIISKTLDGIITSWNPAAEKLFGYTESEMIGQPIMKLIPVELSEEEPLIIERLKRGERVEHFETKRITKTREILDISLTISPVRSSDGTIIGASKIARNITTQKILNEALRESEERLRMAIESTQLGTWEFQPQNGKFTWSVECCKIFNVPPDSKVDYQFFSDFIYPEDRAWVQKEVQTALEPESNRNLDIQYRIIRNIDGQVKWVRAQAKAYFNDYHQLERFVGTLLDITQQKAEEQELKDSVELFQTMADNVPAMIWMSGNDKFNDYFNKAWLAFSGRTQQEESDEGWLKGVHPDDRQECTEVYRTALREQKGFYAEYRLKRYDGQYRWIADNCVPRLSPIGEFAGFISACIDIDDQKRFREKIQDSELLFKTISNAAPVGLWMTDDKAQNTFVNETWVDWTGIPLAKQIIHGWMDAVIGEDRDTTIEKFQAAMRSFQKFSTEFRIQRKDGEIRWCLSEGYPYYDINGGFAGYAGSVTDITELKKLEQRKDDFIKMASHELKTPITSIKGYVQLLLTIYEEMNEEKLRTSAATVKASLSTVSKQVSKLTRLISDLLDMSRIESGKLDLNFVEFDPVLLVEETVQDVRHTTSKHTIIIHNEFEGTLQADRDRIAQVMLNLLTNAIKYSPAADTIDVFVTGDENSVTVSVVDYGIGINKAEQKKIFERFYRVEGKNELTYPGFGIGLFIVSEIIQRHHGTIIVKSEKDKGSAFTFTLPLMNKNNVYE